MRFPIAAPADEVADLIAQFDLVADFQPQIAACVVEGSGLGARRTLTMSDGSQVVERLVEETDHGYAYVLHQGPPHIAAYHIAITVEATGPRSCDVVWALSLRVTPGHDPAPAVYALRSIAELGLESAKRQLERTPAPKEG